MGDVGRRVAWCDGRGVVYEALGTVVRMLPTPDYGDLHVIAWDGDPEGYTEPCGLNEFVFVDGESSGASEG